LWARTYGTLNYNFATSLIETSTQKLVFSNTTEDSGGGLKDANIFISDMGGWFINTCTYGSFSNEETYSMDRCRDNGYVICGYTESYNAEYSNVYVVKTDSMGNSTPFVISVSELEKTKNNYIIYPNPLTSSSLLNISLPNKISPEEEIKIVITDITGNVIKNVDATPNNNIISLPIDNLNNGTYIVNIIINEILVGHAKFVYLN
jgi:hypothetical protein